jgi:hypothetical protein
MRLDALTMVERAARKIAELDQDQSYDPGTEIPDAMLKTFLRAEREALELAELMVANFIDLSTLPNPDEIGPLDNAIETIMLYSEAAETQLLIAEARCNALCTVLFGDANNQSLIKQAKDSSL